MTVRPFWYVLPGLTVFLLFLACSKQPRYPEPPVSGGEIAIAITSLPLEVPQFYTVQYRGSNISFFVLRLNSEIRSFFDACVTCFPKKLGYAAEDGRVVCRACNTAYSIHKLDMGVGGCYPIQLKGRTVEGSYRIPLASVYAEAAKF